MLFGDEQYERLPEELIQVLVENGVAQAEWEQIGRLMGRRDQAGGRFRNTGPLIQKLTALGLVGGALRAAFNAAVYPRKRHEGEMPGLGGFGHMTEKERKKQRQEQLKKDAQALVATGAVELDASGRITGNKHGVEGNLIEHEVKKEALANLPVIDQVPWNDREDNFDDLDELLAEDWTPDSEFIDEGEVDKMDVDSGPGGEPVTAEARAASSGSSIGAGNTTKETPVLQNAKPSYGLQETHTTLCNFDGFFSAVFLDHTAPLVTEFRVTSPGDCFATTLKTLAVNTAWAKELYNVPYNAAASRDTATASEFPIKTIDAAYTAERASWFNYWAKIYEYYTVLSCDYEIVINNPTGGNLNDALVAWDFNSYSDTAGATGNKTPQDATLMDMMTFKGIKWTKINSTTAIADSTTTKVIRGTYIPGMANRNVSNDGDVKTWNLTDVFAQPTLKEFLTLYFYKGALSYAKPATLPVGLNVQYKLKYKIQFKDLRLNARYPKTGGTAITQTISTDVMQTS